jgi:hypothetical protein
MQGKSAQQIARTIEGVVALCLGSADRLVWVDQADAAAFTDGEKIYLPRPTGEHVQEYDLLLAIAMREVGKFHYCDTSDVVAETDEVRPYGVAIEEARIKKELSIPYLGAKEIFDKAFTVVTEIVTQRIKGGDTTPETVNALAVWATAQHSFLKTDSSASNMNKLYELAAMSTDRQVLDNALGLARQAVLTGSTQEAMLLGKKVYTLLQTQPEPPQAEPQPESQGNPEEDSKADQPENTQSEQAGKQGKGDDSKAEQPAQGQPPDDSDQPGQDQSGGEPAQSQSTQCEQAGEPESKNGSEPSPCESNPAQDDGKDGEAQPGGGQATDQSTGEQPAEASPSGPNGNAQKQPEPGQGQSAESKDGAGSSQDGPTPGQGEATGGSAQPGDGQATEQPSDVMSDALSMMRGFKGSRDVSSQAKELEQLQSAQPESKPTEQQLGDLEKALAQAESVALALQEAMAKGAPQLALVPAAADTGEANATAPEQASQETPEPAPDGNLSLVMCGGGAGGGYATSDDLGGNSMLSGVQGKLVSVFLREFQGITRRQLLLRNSGQRVSASQSWRLKRLGDTRIFLPKTKGHGVETAVSILLDRSGSMDGDIEVAANVTYALALAMERIKGVQASIDVFPGFDGPVEEILGFKQNVRTAKQRLEVLTAEGGTPTGRAMAMRLGKLYEHKADKKVMLIPTDGMPDRSELELVRLLLKNAEENGVEVIGIGIGAAARVELIFDNYIKVASVGGLASAFEALFKGDIAAKLAA